MGNEQFIKIVKHLVYEYTNLSHGAQVIDEDSVYIVWVCKTLQNHKALASTPVSDGMYYEITYNGDKDELYFDAYKKQENKCIRNPMKLTEQ